MQVPAPKPVPAVKLKSVNSSKPVPMVAADALTTAEPGVSSVKNSERDALASAPDPLSVPVPPKVAPLATVTAPLAPSVVGPFRSSRNVAQALNAY